MFNEWSIDLKNGKPSMHYIQYVILVYQLNMYKLPQKHLFTFSEIISNRTLFV